MAAAARVSRTHRNAITRMLRSTGLSNVPEEAPLVELLKELAKEMDEGGGARTRLAYLSALKDLRRVLGPASTGRARGSAEPAASAAAEKAVADAEEVAVRPNELAEFKQRHGIAS